MKLTELQNGRIYRVKTGSYTLYVMNGGPLHARYLCSRIGKFYSTNFAFYQSGYEEIQDEEEYKRALSCLENGKHVDFDKSEIESTLKDSYTIF